MPPARDPLASLGGRRWLQIPGTKQFSRWVGVILGGSDPAVTLAVPLQELELVEDVWRGEAQDLLSQIAQLQEENKQLMTNLNHKDVGFSEEEFQKQEGEARHPSSPVTTPRPRPCSCCLWLLWAGGFIS